MKLKKTILLYSLILIFDLLFSIYIFVIRPKSQNNTQIKNIKPTISETVPDLKPIKQPSKFTTTNITQKDISANQTIEIVCKTPVKEFKTNIVLIPSENFQNQKIIDKVFPVSENNILLTKKADNQSFYKLTIPENLPPVNFIARLDFFSVDNNLLGGCVTNKFLINNNQPFILISDLVNPKENLDLISKISDTDKNITFKIESNGDFTNLKPIFLLKDLNSKDKIYFRKELPISSFNKNEVGEFPINISDFKQTGIFQAELEFLDNQNNKVSASPDFYLNIGINATIKELKNISLVNNNFKSEIIYNNVNVPDPSLNLIALIKNSDGTICGQRTYDISDSWPDIIEITKSNSCNANQIEILLKKKILFNKSLEIYTEQLNIN